MNVHSNIKKRIYKDVCVRKIWKQRRKRKNEKRRRKKENKEEKKEEKGSGLSIDLLHNSKSGPKIGIKLTL